ncbi:ABC transporter substrate-binding protein [Caballeronia novacaledonica]|uniref:ABC transporter substrate-binding protein n=1 Tax=Caballeronia novacaledonica TaxID=1544861 RepID=A0AA37MQW1_9BURK|nr:ABC transporter substrate-binding protein [Caballeronia novacaledonica]GJH27076.1 ABC transporter substrate-binding protein [Caballeronia novacaledonica]
MNSTFIRRRSIVASALAAIPCAFFLTSMPAFGQECEIKLGVAGPMTGGGASWGLSEKAAVEFEAAWTNANGGLPLGTRKCKVSVVSVDAQSTAAGGAAAANYLASEGVHAVIGPMLGPEITGFKPVAKRNGQVNFTTSFAANAIGPEFPLVFHELQSPPVWSPPIVKIVKDRFKLKTVVIVGPNDQGGTDPGNALAKTYNDAGVKASTEWYQRGTTNFSPIVVRLMSMNPDALELGGMPPGEATILVKQMREAGYEGVFGRLGAGGDIIIKDSGGIEKQKSFYWFDHIPTQEAGMKRMGVDFERLMKRPVPDMALWYNQQIAAELMLKAVSTAGTDQDGEKIASALRNMVPESRYAGKAGWRGKAQYGINQELSFPVAVNFIENGKREVQVKIEIPVESTK